MTGSKQVSSSEDGQNPENALMAHVGLPAPEDPKAETRTALIWVSDFGFQVQGFGFRVSGLGFRV